VESTRRYSWQRRYKAAILSTDDPQLPALITAAQAAIHARLAEIASKNDATLDERVALEDARNGLLILIKKPARPVRT
jgi:hypothetical protein